MAKSESDAAAAKPIKCLVWDLDNTLWDGTLLEADRLSLRKGVLQALQDLDARGVLHSIASKNEAADAQRQLAALGVDDYFLYPQIGWGPKSQSVQAVAEALNIGLDAVGFIDDQPFERDEVGFQHPAVRLYSADEAAGLSDRKEFQPRFVTDDSRRRREMYRADEKRRRAEEHFEGPQDAFLETLDMRLSLDFAGEDDLARAEELTVRTNQLNTTGRVYSYEELDALRASKRHAVLVARLTDRYGDYGVIGLSLLEDDGDAVRLRLLLMSCRVMARGVGGVFLNYFRRMAAVAGKTLYADFKKTDRNRMMFVTFRFAGFREADRHGEACLRSDEAKIPPTPAYMKVAAPGKLPF